jgi:HD-like signal output (HDOD) protein
MPECQESFVAGVLHDVGHLMCNEPDAAGGRHGYLGSYAAALWGFPVNVVDAIREHHRPPWGKQASLGSALWFADRIADSGQSALDDPSLETRFDPGLTLRWREVGFRMLQQEPNKQENAHRAAGSHR